MCQKFTSMPSYHKISTDIQTKDYVKNKVPPFGLSVVVTSPKCSPKLTGMLQTGMSQQGLTGSVVR